MGREEDEEKWQNYLKHFFHGIGAPVLVDEESGLPYIFATPICASCQHWWLIHRDDINNIQNPTDISLIEKGIDGKILKYISFGDSDHDAYYDHVFYGWCKRYPPIIHNSNSITRFHSLFSLISSKVTRIAEDHRFPLMSHMETCGEWRQGGWVEEFVNENKASK